MSITLTGHTLTCAQVAAVAKECTFVSLSPEAAARIDESRQVVQKYIDENKIAYGVTTGVGKLCNTLVSPAQSAQLQANISLSHACGIGEALSEAEARAIMVIRANTFCLGYSGIRRSTVQLILDMLNSGITPILPKKGGVGSSGSLSLGAHLSLAMRGLNDVLYQGQRMPASQAFAKANLVPVVFEAKECLSMINGTHAMCGIGCLALTDLWTAVKSAEICAAVSLEALTGNTAAFDLRLNGSKNHPGQLASAENISLLLNGSSIYTLPHKNVQDAYSHRCLPQIHGAARDLLNFVETQLEQEINGASDNPLVFPAEEEILSGGNFHGQSAAIALDNLSIACATVAKITERRISRLTDPQSSGLPAFLINGSGLNSGLMIPQYVAANLATEIKLAAMPVSVDTIPTSGGQEDVISNGTIAANQARDAVYSLMTIVGIEAICSVQALELSRRDNLGFGVVAAHTAIREAVAPLQNDRFMEPDILAAADLIKSGELLRRVEEVTGKLQ